MTEPLLEVSKLTVRFGGLTAVSEVDLRVGRGEVVAVIGPNGAGKTTLFNAIAGIYEPSSGSVRFRGAELARPFLRSLLLYWSLLGVSVAALFVLFVADVDGLWAATIKANYGGPQVGFSTGGAWESAKDYLRASPRIERKLGRYQVSSHDGTLNFGSTATRAEAEKKRELYERIGEIEAQDDAIVQQGSSYAIQSADGAVLLADLESRAEAEQALTIGSGARASARSARLVRIASACLGLLIGFGAGYAIWRQTRRAPAFIASRGIARTFQNIRLFQDMTVLDNVLVGMDRHLLDRSPWYSRKRLAYVVGPALLALTLLAIGILARSETDSSALLGVALLGWFAAATAYIAHLARLGAFSPNAVRMFARAHDEAMRLLEFVGLDRQAHTPSRNLAYGDQRRLEIARALATEPQLLLLDEPAAGMNPFESGELTKLIRAIRERGVTVLLIEHHMRVVMGISDRIYVLEYGRKIAEGTPQEIQANPKVIEAYLGKEELG